MMQQPIPPVPPFTLRFTCPGCAAILEAASTSAGSVVLCPYCSASMCVPDACILPTVEEQPAFLTPSGSQPAPSPRSEAPLPKPMAPLETEPDDDTGRKYYIRKGKKEYGPFTSRELRKLARKGKLSPTDLIWKKGFKDWKPAAKAKGLFSDRPPRP